MNRKRVAAELPAEMVSWLEQHGSARLWYAVACDVALEVGAALLVNDGEAGVNRTVYKLLCEHTSQAVRRLARSAKFPQRRWYAKSVALRVAEFFGVSSDALYQELRWKKSRENTPMDSCQSELTIRAV